MSLYCIFQNEEDASKYDNSCLSYIESIYPSINAIHWSQPLQRLDGKWIVLQLENCPTPENCTIEEFSSSWFPVNDI